MENTIENLILILGLAAAVVVYLLLIKNKNAEAGAAGKSDQLILENGTLKGKLEEQIRKENELKAEILKLEENIKNQQNKIAGDGATISMLETRLFEQQKSMEEKNKILHESEEKLKQEFTTLANEILEKNSKKLQEESQKGLGTLLNPMKLQLEDFKKKVEDVYDKESKDRSALQNELKNLKELNLKISTDALNLTNALKGQSKQQGVWGEMILEKVLESSGLREGYEYKREVSLKDGENNRFRPDVIVNLPDDRHIIIDAKTSLNAYNEYIAEESDELKMSHLKSHIFAIKEHIKSLADKKYENLENVNSLDFIFMFVPIENALMIALENDVNLYDFAFKQKIILVSPTTLLVALRAVENSWRYEKQAQSIADVAKRAEELYTKFVNFTVDIEKIGEGIKKADESYNDALKKLSEGKGNLVWQAEQLKIVSNIKPKKEISKNILSD